VPLPAVAVHVYIDVVNTVREIMWCSYIQVRQARRATLCKLGFKGKCASTGPAPVLISERRFILVGEVKDVQASHLYTTRFLSQNQCLLLSHCADVCFYRTADTAHYSSTLSIYVH
jgi:hypothetical protein